jgi:hypothetical protein
LMVGPNLLSNLSDYTIGGMIITCLALIQPLAAIPARQRIARAEV